MRLKKHKIKTELITLLITSLLLLAWSTSISADVSDCGGLENAFGPFDYRKYQGSNQLWLVESTHFTREVEALERGRGGGLGIMGAMSDIDYTLRAFPNHHRALYGAVRFELKYGIPQPSRYRTIDCYFDRAMRLAPDDGVVRLVYGIYLHRTKQFDSALERYNEALTLEPDSTETHYNLGLLYLDMNKLDLANKHAVVAYKSGYPLSGLKNQLIKRGVWNEEAATARKAEKN